jgi:hypothetical protein
MTKNKISFDWSLLSRDFIAVSLWELAPTVVKNSITPIQFHKIISNHLKKIVPVKIRKSFHDKKISNNVLIGGVYYSDYDQRKEKCIEIIFEYSQNDKKLNISNQKYCRICYNIADTLLHEIMHMRQFRRRRFKDLPDYPSDAKKLSIRQEQSYLGNEDEIDAYSFNIACELIDKFGMNQTKILKYLNENQRGKNRKHNCWRMYLKAFQHDHNHKVIKKVKKKVLRYLPAAEYGRPYRTKEWINR